MTNLKYHNASLSGGAGRIGRASPRAAHGEQRRGAAAVELAIILSLLLTLTFGCVDLGRIIAAYLAVTNAARAGAEYGATHRFTAYTSSSWQSQISQIALQELQNVPSYAAANATVTVTTSTDSGGQTCVAVSVSYPFQSIVAWTGLPLTVPMAHQVEMRQYQ